MKIIRDIDSDICSKLLSRYFNIKIVFYVFLNSYALKYLYVIIYNI